MLKKINNYHIFILIIIVFILNTILFRSINLTFAQFPSPPSTPGEQLTNIVVNPLQEDLNLGNKSIISIDKIGIGTDEPRDLLEIFDSITGYIYFSGTHDVGLRADGPMTFDIDTNNNSENAYLQITKDGTNYDSSQATELMRIQEDGRVGIGTNQPTSQLDIMNPGSWVNMKLINDEEGNGLGHNLEIIQGWNSYIKASDALYFSANGVNDFVVMKNGKVGIGTEPNKNLHIYDNTGNAEINLQSGGEDGEHWGIYHDNESDDLIFWNENDKLSISSNGNMSLLPTGDATGWSDTYPSNSLVFKASAWDSDQNREQNPFFIRSRGLDCSAGECDGFVQDWSPNALQISSMYQCCNAGEASVEDPTEEELLFEIKDDYGYNNNSATFFTDLNVTKNININKNLNIDNNLNINGGVSSNMSLLPTGDATGWSNTYPSNSLVFGASAWDSDQAKVQRKFLIRSRGLNCDNGECDGLSPDGGPQALQILSDYQCCNAESQLSSEEFENFENEEVLFEIKDDYQLNAHSATFFTDLNVTKNITASGSVNVGGGNLHIYGQDYGNGSGEGGELWLDKWTGGWWSIFGGDSAIHFYNEGVLVPFSIDSNGANMGDINLSNENRKPNEIDGTQGSWTIQEGDDNLFLINRNTGKKYSFVLKEIE